MGALAAAMDEDPGHWRAYVAADALEPIARLYGLSDRVRYYWPAPAVETAVRRLLASIDAANVPPGLVSQFVGWMLPEDRTTPLSLRIIEAKVGAVVETYRRACGAPAED